MYALRLERRAHRVSEGAVAISNGPTVKDALDKGLRYEQTLGISRNLERELCDCGSSAHLQHRFSSLGIGFSRKPTATVQLLEPLPIREALGIQRKLGTPGPLAWQCILAASPRAVR